MLESFRKYGGTFAASASMVTGGAPPTLTIAAPKGPTPPTTMVTVDTGFLSVQARKSLLAQMLPLAIDSIPEPSDLSAWWSSVEGAIHSLDPSFADLDNPLRFHSVHVATFAPAILGVRGW